MMTNNNLIVYISQKVLAQCLEGNVIDVSSAGEACDIPLYLHPPVGPTTEETAALKRFEETCEDGEGYDVPKEMMKHLASIGVVNHLSAGYYKITRFGEAMLEFTA